MSKILVCGGRNAEAGKWMFDALGAHVREGDIVIHGGASGVDRIAGIWAREHNIETHVYLPGWDVYGKSAGPIRNRQMLVEEEPDLVLAFPGGRGTRHMMMIAKDAGVRVVRVTKDGWQ